MIMGMNDSIGPVRSSPRSESPQPPLEDHDEEAERCANREHVQHRRLQRYENRAEAIISSRIDTPITSAKKNGSREIILAVTSSYAAVIPAM